MSKVSIDTEELVKDGGDDDEDPLDILDDGLSNLFGIPPIAFSSPSSGFYTYIPPGSLEGPIKLRIPTPSADVFTKLQANHLWLSALYLADLICTDDIHLGGRVVELGAGAGLPGIVACRRGCTVLSTDWGDESILRCLKDNFGRSCPEGRWDVQGHEWGSDIQPLLAFNRTTEPLDADSPVNDLPDPLSKGRSQIRSLMQDRRFDTILLADTLWISAAHSALLDSLKALLHPEGRIHVAAGLHTGRWPIESFTIKAEERGMHVERVREVKWLGEGEWEERTTTKMVGASGSGEERGMVVYLRMSWRASHGARNANVKWQISSDKYLWVVSERPASCPARVILNLLRQRKSRLNELSDELNEKQRPLAARERRVEARELSREAEKRRFTLRSSRSPPTEELLAASPKTLTGKTKRKGKGAGERRTKEKLGKDGPVTL